MANTPETLNDLLTQLGHPIPTTRPDPSAFGYDLADEPYGTHVEAWCLFEPLSQRGWVLHFDAEGSFMCPTEHSKLIGAILTLANIDPIPQIQDVWRANQGWVMLIKDPTHPIAYQCEDTSEYPSDWAELGLVLAMINDYLPNHTVVNMITGDQTACLAILPTPVYEHLIEEEWMGEPEEQWEPEVDFILIEATDELLEHNNGQPIAWQEAEKIIKDAPSDWFA